MLVSNICGKLYLDRRAAFQNRVVSLVNRPVVAAIAASYLALSAATSAFAQADQAALSTIRLVQPQIAQAAPVPSPAVIPTDAAPFTVGPERNEFTPGLKFKIFQPADPTAPTSNTGGNTNALAAFFAFLQQSLLNQQTITLNEQLGTRIATDYTPVYPQNHMAPTRLQGGVAVDNNGRMPGQAMFGATNFNAEELLALQNNGVIYGPHTGDSYINLLQGYVLFAPERDIEVEVREGKVYIPKGAIAWVMETGADSAIYDLHDTMQTGPIRVVANSKTLTLGPGQQVLLTRNMNATFAELNPGLVVGYRNVKSADMGGGIKSYICEFSIPHGLNNVEVINGLLYSKEDKHQKIVRHMLKNAAILADLSAQKYRNK